VPAGIADLLVAGRKLHQAGRLAEAEVWYRRALAAQPNNADALNSLGIVALQTGRHGLAVELTRQAIQRDGENSIYFGNLGNAFYGLGKFHDAVAAYRKALSIKPDSAEAHSNLGAAQEQLGKLDEAIAAYRRAISLKPDYADAHANLGVALEEQGKLDEARNAFEKAIELAPARAVNYRLLSEVKRFSATDQHLAAMEKLARDMGSLSSQDQIDLHFALAKAYGDLGDHEGSFRHLLDGNALKRQRMGYDEPLMLAMFDRIRSVFTPELMRDKQTCGHTSSVPVFIVGMPRSGTTLVEQILASHPKVFGAGEISEFVNAMERFTSPNEATARFPEVVSSMPDDQLRQLGASYVSAISALAPNAERVVDKMPMNFLFAGLIHLVLPNARIIHTRRDPLDTCLSCFSKLFTNRHQYSYDLAELGRYYRGYEMLMEHWRRVLPPGVMLEVQYEQLITDLEGEARRIVGHCGLEWDAACLSFHETERAVRTTIQVRQPIYRSSIGRWRVYEHQLGPLIEALGVDVAGGSRRAPSAGVEDGWATSAGSLPPLVTDKATVDERAYGRDVPALRRSLGETAGRLREGDTPASQILIDGIKAVTIHNGVLRIDCVAAGPNNEERPSGTLLIPGNQAGPILRSLIQGVQELEKKMRGQAQPEATGQAAN
jgi:Tfp pilus assembly protein PilF